MQFSDAGSPLELVVGEQLVVPTTAVAIERHGVMLALTDVDANQDIDGVIE